MDGTELFRLIINSNLTWAAALTIMAVALRPVLTGLVEGLVASRKEQAHAMHERNANEKEQTRVLSEVRDTLADNAKITSAVLSLIQNVAALPAIIEDANKRMTARADARDGMLTVQTQRLEQLHQSVANLPADIMVRASSHLDPQFTRVMAAIGDLKMEIQNAQEVMTPGIVKEIRVELARIAKLVTALADNGHTAKPPAPRRTRKAQAAPQSEEGA